MTCQSSSVPTTPASASQVARPTRQSRRRARSHAAGRPGCRSSTRQRDDRGQRRASTPEHHHAPSSARVGDGDEAGVDVDARAQPGLCGHLQVGEHACDLRLLLVRQGAGGAGDADEVGADAARVRPDVQRAARAGAARPARGATAATESRNATTTMSALARTNRPLRLASMPADGMVENTRPPVCGQRGHRLARDRRIEGKRGAGHQRRGHVGDQPVGADRLRPVDRRGGLADREQRGEHAEQHTGDARDDRDQSSSPGGHEAQG